MHLAGRARVVGQGAMQHAAVVPDDEVAEAPLVAVDAVWRGRPGEDVVEERLTLLGLHPTT